MRFFILLRLYNVAFQDVHARRAGPQIILSHSAASKPRHRRKRFNSSPVFTVGSFLKAHGFFHIGSNGCHGFTFFNPFRTNRLSLT